MALHNLALLCGANSFVLFNGWSYALVGGRWRRTMRRPRSPTLSEANDAGPGAATSSADPVTDSMPYSTSVLLLDMLSEAEPRGSTKSMITLWPARWPTVIESVAEPRTTELVKGPNHPVP